jgi:hypothetical protein
MSKRNEDVRPMIGFLMIMGLFVVFTTMLNVMVYATVFNVNCDEIPLMKSHKTFIIVGGLINMFITTMSTIILINKTFNKDGKY